MTVLKRYTGSAWEVVGVPQSGTTALLAATRYDPGTYTEVTTTSTTMTAIDTTNLIVAFTAPPSGIVHVRLEGFAILESAGGNYSWGLIDASGGATVGKALIISSGAATQSYRFAATFRVTGLTPAAAYTYRWAHLRTIGGTGKFKYGDTGGGIPAVMEVWSAP